MKLRNNIIKGIDPDDRNVQSDYDLEYLDSDFNVFDADAWFKLGESEVQSIQTGVLSLGWTLIPSPVRRRFVPFLSICDLRGAILVPWTEEIL